MSLITSSFQKIEVILASIKNDLFQLSHLDGVASFNEKALIYEITSTLPTLRLSIKKFFSDGVITEDEKISLHKLITMFMDRAVTIAKYDNNIEYDEKVLLKLIKNHLSNLINEIKKM